MTPTSGVGPGVGCCSSWLGAGEELAAAGGQELHGGLSSVLGGRPVAPPCPNTHPIALDAHVSFETREAVFTLQGNQRQPQSGGENPHLAHPPHSRCWVGTLSSPTQPSGAVSLLTLCLLQFWPGCSKKAAALEAWLHCAPPRAGSVDTPSLESLSRVRMTTGPVGGDRWI